MVVKGQDVSNNPKDNKQYDRILYWCQDDDIWINLEVPKD